MILPGVIAGAAFGASGPATDPYYADTVAIWDATGQADGTSYVTDGSPLDLPFSHRGNATIVGGKFDFDGSNDALSRSGPVSSYVPVGAATWEFFGVQMDSISTSAFASYYHANLSNNKRSWIVGFRSTSGGSLYLFSSSTGSGSSAVSHDIPWTPTPGETYDIAVAWDGTDIRAYVDGAYVGKAAYSGTFHDPSSDIELLLGGSEQDGGIANDFGGQIAAFRFTNGVDRFSASETTIPVPSLPLPTA